MLLPASVAAAVYGLFGRSGQMPGMDFICLWEGARTALSNPARLYDFEYITSLQNWPLGPGRLRPYIYPPSALFAFLPFAIQPYWVAYTLFVGATGAAFLAAARLAKAPWWFLLLPPVILVAFGGQVTFLIGALALGAVALKDRPIVAGVLLGLGVAIKPQILLLAPVALVADRQWRTFVVSGLVAAAMMATSVAVWGWRLWLEWFEGVKRFNAIVFGADANLLADALTPYAMLKARGLDANFAFVLAPISVFAVWQAFRLTRDPVDRYIALIAGALIVTPYAMNYEAALFAPAVATYLSRTTDPRWGAYVALTGAYAFSLGVFPMGSLLAAAFMPVVRITFKASAPDAQLDPAH